jgi:hypothetical protein
MNFKNINKIKVISMKYNNYKVWLTLIATSSILGVFSHIDVLGSDFKFDLDEFKSNKEIAQKNEKNTLYDSLESKLIQDSKAEYEYLNGGKHQSSDKDLFNLFHDLYNNKVSNKAYDILDRTDKSMSFDVLKTSIQDVVFNIVKDTYENKEHKDFPYDKEIIKNYINAFKDLYTKACNGNEPIKLSTIKDAFKPKNNNYHANNCHELAISSERMQHFAHEFTSIGELFKATKSIRSIDGKAIYKWQSGFGSKEDIEHCRKAIEKLHNELTRSREDTISGTDEGLIKACLNRLDERVEKRAYALCENWTSEHINILFESVREDILDVMKNSNEDIFKDEKCIDEFEHIEIDTSQSVKEICNDIIYKSHIKSILDIIKKHQKDNVNITTERLNNISAIVDVFRICSGAIVIPHLKDSKCLKSGARRDKALNKIQSLIGMDVKSAHKRPKSYKKICDWKNNCIKSNILFLDDSVKIKNLIQGVRNYIEDKKNDCKKMFYDCIGSHLLKSGEIRLDWIKAFDDEELTKSLNKDLDNLCKREKRKCTDIFDHFIKEGSCGIRNLCHKYQQENCLKNTLIYHVVDRVLSSYGLFIENHSDFEKTCARLTFDCIQMQKIKSRQDSYCEYTSNTRYNTCISKRDTCNMKTSLDDPDRAFYKKIARFIKLSNAKEVSSVEDIHKDKETDIESFITAHGLSIDSNLSEILRVCISDNSLSSQKLVDAFRNLSVKGEKFNNNIMNKESQVDSVLVEELLKQKLLQFNKGDDLRYPPYMHVVYFDIEPSDLRKLIEKKQDSSCVMGSHIGSEENICEVKGCHLFRDNNIPIMRKYISLNYDNEIRVTLTPDLQSHRAPLYELCNTSDNSPILSHRGCSFNLSCKLPHGMIYGKAKKEGGTSYLHKNHDFYKDLIQEIMYNEKGWEDSCTGKESTKDKNKDFKVYRECGFKYKSDKLKGVLFIVYYIKYENAPQWSVYIFSTVYPIFLIDEDINSPDISLTLFNQKVEGEIKTNLISVVRSIIGTDKDTYKNKNTLHNNNSLTSEVVYPIKADSSTDEYNDKNKNTIKEILLDKKFQRVKADKDMYCKMIYDKPSSVDKNNYHILTLSKDTRSFNIAYDKNMN